MNQEHMLAKILDGDIELIDTYSNKYDRYNSECKILITPQQIAKILADYLNKKLNPMELQKWADFLCHNDALYTPRHEGEDYYEDMWHVLQKISTPFIDGEINVNNISEYLTELNNKYKMSC